MEVKPMTWSIKILDDATVVFKVEHNFVVSALSLKEVPDLDFGDFNIPKATSYIEAKHMWLQELPDSKKESFYQRQMVEFAGNTQDDDVTKKQLVTAFNHAQISKNLIGQQLAIRAYVETFWKKSEGVEVLGNVEYQTC